MRINNERGFFLWECLERVLIFFAGQGGRQDGIGKLFSRRQHSFVVLEEARESISAADLLLMGGYPGYAVSRASGDECWGESLEGEVDR